MTDSIILAAQKEYDSLINKRTQIDNRINELETFLRVAKSLSSDSAKTAMDILSRKTAPSTFKDQVISITQELLEGGKHMGSRELVEAIESRGITVKAPDMSKKVIRVSSILVKAKQFKSDRSRGWSLITTEDQVGGLSDEIRDVLGIPDLHSHA